MKKNTAGQYIGAQMVSATDGSAFTSAVTVYVTGDAGTQAVGSVGSGACTHEGNGFHTYAPSQAETNYDHIGFTFIGTGAVPATVQVYPSFPQTGDNFARLGAPAGASIAADIATRLAPTTAGRTLDVTAGGCAGIDWANVEAPTTAVNLSATNIDVDQVVASVSGAVGSVTGAVGSVTGAVGSVTGNVGGNVVGSVASVTAGVTLAASAVQAIWDALESALTTAGSIGKKLADWTIGTAQTGDAYARLGAPAGASVSADVAAIKAETANILADTGTDGVVVSAASVRTAVGLASANLDTQLDALPTTAEVNAQVVDALATDTYAELGAAPAATASITTMLGWLFALARNKMTQTSTTSTLRNDADSGNIATSTISDNGTTFTRGEWS